LSSVFRTVFSDIERVFVGTAKSGQNSMKNMVDAILADLARLAFRKFVEQPITNFLTSVIDQLFKFGGGRAVGGPVSEG
jgi:hypothetical protein